MKKCLYCDEEFEPGKYGVKARFCSKTCVNKHIIRSAKAYRKRRKAFNGLKLEIETDKKVHVGYLEEITS